MHKFFIIFSAFTFSIALDFSEGPYGSEYFDTAGPLILDDLNAFPLGDTNEDNILNIQDLIIMVQYVIGNTSEINTVSDVNSDEIIDILDIVICINLILEGYDPVWDFQLEWNGQDCYIFINYTAASGALIASNTKDLLLENSPMNVHYLFISDRTTYETDIPNLKNDFDEIISNMSEDLQTHWGKHLHFIPEKTSFLNNWLEEALQGEDAIAIDRFQRIRETGYFGNPASFTGTFIHYLAHEALYFNYEYDNIYQPDLSYDEISIFEREHYTGGWAASISKLITLPTNEELSNYSGLSVELLRGCPDANMNYSDAGCDDYDRKAYLFICDEDETNCFEIARWITPFDRQPHHLTDITPFISALRPGGDKVFKFQEDGWPNSLLTLKLRLYNDSNQSGNTPYQMIPIWNGTVQFNPEYDDNRPPASFFVPENASKVEFVSYITGHGWGDNTCYNCCEFCNSRHIFTTNGGTFNFDIDFPNANLNTYCMSTEAISNGTIPNQYGTWGYGRAGWCPGQNVKPFITDITNYMNFGNDNVIDYNACRVSGNSCVTAPGCGTCGYCPEIAFSSYIIIYFEN